MPTQEGSELVVLTWGRLCHPRGHLAMSGDTFDCRYLGEHCWHLAGGQGPC